jgi:hypothetical protein
MKMAKRLLLGSAAALVVVWETQAAELPVKAAPVQYVKICDLYGNGWYYIPGSDTCLKFGGYVRLAYNWNQNGGGTPAWTGTQGAQDRTVSNYSTGARGQLQTDARTQTEYGTVRTYISGQWQQNDQAQSAAIQRAFIQWAGFTFGHAQSFSDTWNIGESYAVGQQNNADTAGAGINTLAYTTELGNGMTLTVGADDPRRKPLLNFANVAAIKAGTEPVNSYAGVQWPDINLDFKINQEWGYFAVSGIAHDVRATYYNCQPTLAGQFTGTGTPFDTCGRPDDKIGWTVAAGLELRLDFLSPGDHAGMGVRYAQGNSMIGGGSNLNSASLFGRDDVVAVGWQTDGVFFGHCATNMAIPISTLTGSSVNGQPPAPTAICHADGTQIELTTTWNISGAYEHYWAPNLRTAVYGSYSEVHYNDNAKSLWAKNVCQFPSGSTQTVPDNVFTSSSINAGFNSVASQYCDPDWAYFQGGLRHRWSPVAGMNIDVVTAFVHVFSAFKGANAFLANTNTSATQALTTLTTPIIGARAAGYYTIKDETTYFAGLRVQRIFNGAD